MRRPSCHNLVAFFLLILVSLLAASCASSSDSSNSEDTTATSVETITLQPDNAPIAIAAGYYRSCALHQTGIISCWGINYYGQLGNGNDAYSSVPAKVVDITDATAIATGGHHSCALHQDSTISCWGHSDFGQLGNQTDDIYSLVPMEVAGITDATAIATGGYHSCALHEDGTISCWGDNEFAQLGNGQGGYDSQSFVPVEIADITDATAVTTGSEHSCALHQDGTISCWGGNGHKQLGNGGGRSYVPVQVANITDATAITTGGAHSCTLHEDSTISCWRRNYYGELDITDATAITEGDSHSCTLHQTGTVSCLGNNAYGQLGNGIWFPQPVVGFGGRLNLNDVLAISISKF